MPDKDEKHEPLLPKHGGYRNLKSFQTARLVYDITVRFSERYIDQFSRTRDQMVQAARSGVQNIAEGSAASGTSKKTELKLTNVAKASLEELRLDYEDFLRQKKMAMWKRGEPLREELAGKYLKTADEVAQWIIAAESALSSASAEEKERAFACLSANAALMYIDIASGLLHKQLNTLAAEFEKNGGFTERLYRVRKNNQRRPE